MPRSNADCEPLQGTHCSSQGVLCLDIPASLDSATYGSWKKKSTKPFWGIKVLHSNVDMRFALYQPGDPEHVANSYPFKRGLEIRRTMDFRNPECSRPFHDIWYRTGVSSGGSFVAPTGQAARICLFYEPVEIILPKQDLATPVDRTLDIGVASTAVADGNASRAYMYFKNNSNGWITLKFVEDNSRPTATESENVKLAAGEVFEMSEDDGGFFSYGMIEAIAELAASELIAWECNARLDTR